MKELSDQQLLRYSRQIMLPELDIAGQQRLLASQVLIIGLGGLGSPAALYLGAAGVGKLVLADPDRVELANLQRQIAHGSSDIGRLKVESAAARVHEINPEVQLQTIPRAPAPEELEQLVSTADLVVDASDNFATRFALNRTCVQQSKPLVSAAIIRQEGQLAVFEPARPESPCYRCLYPERPAAPESCSESGILAPLAGVMGSLQAMEAVKLLSGAGKTLTGRLLLFEGATGEWRNFKLPRDPDCPACSQRPRLAKTIP